MAYIDVKAHKIQSIQNPKAYKKLTSQTEVVEDKKKRKKPTFMNQQTLLFIFRILNASYLEETIYLFLNMQLNYFLPQKEVWLSDSLQHLITLEE